MREMIIAICDHCGRSFQAAIADRRRGWARCCSKSCAASNRSVKSYANTTTTEKVEVVLDGTILPESEVKKQVDHNVVLEDYILL